MVYIPKSLYKAQELQVMGNIFVVTELSTLLIITRVSSGSKISQMLIFSKYKYLHVKIASLANVKILRHRESNFINGKCLALYSPSELPLRLSSLTEDT